MLARAYAAYSEPSLILAYPTCPRSAKCLLSRRGYYSLPHLSYHPPLPHPSMTKVRLTRHIQPRSTRNGSLYRFGRLARKLPARSRVVGKLPFLLEDRADLNRSMVMEV